MNKTFFLNTAVLSYKTRTVTAEHQRKDFTGTLRNWQPTLQSHCHKPATKTKKKCANEKQGPPSKNMWNRIAPTYRERVALALTGSFCYRCHGFTDFWQRAEAKQLTREVARLWGELIDQRQVLHAVGTQLKKTRQDEIGNWSLTLKSTAEVISGRLKKTRGSLHCFNRLNSMLLFFQTYILI